VAAVTQTVATATELARRAAPTAPWRVFRHEPATFWHGWSHLLYLPVLGLARPADLYYYQGPGLQALCQFTYKYLPLERFLGELSHLQLGYPLAWALATCYSQAWYPGVTPLFIFTDWHDKPLWTKYAAHAGPMSMWGRVMPGTKQLLLNGPDGHWLGGWDYAVDTCLPGVLVDLEASLADHWQRPIAYTVCDSEGGGLPTGQRYVAAHRHYISVLPRGESHPLTDFAVVEPWAPVPDDPTHEAVAAHWQDGARAQADPRRLVLLRRVNTTDPVRVYTGHWPAEWPASSIPGRFRQRWAHQERRIRDLVNGANLNVNYGYTALAVPDRTQQRRQAAAQAQLTACEQRLLEQHEALLNRTAQGQALQDAAQTAQDEVTRQITELQAEIAHRQAAGQTWRRQAQTVQRWQRTLVQAQTRLKRQLARLEREIAVHQARCDALAPTLAARQAACDALAPPGLRRERELEKDQLMLDCQILLDSLHDWVRHHYLAPVWQTLELPTATELLYRKAGRVTWAATHIEVVLEPYRYAEQQQLMEETCRRFNAVPRYWRDGRLLHIRVTPDPKLQLCDCQGAGQT